MSLKNVLNYMKLASSYVKDNQPEKAMSSIMLALDCMETSGISPEDFDAISINEVEDIKPNPEVANQLSFLINEARN